MCTENAKKIKYKLYYKKLCVYVCCQPKGSRCTHVYSIILLLNEYYVYLLIYTIGRQRGCLVLLCRMRQSIWCACCDVGRSRKIWVSFLAVTKLGFIAEIVYNELNTVVAFKASQRNCPFFRVISSNT